jgi:hypothetical protein
MITRADRQSHGCPVRFTDEEDITGEGRLFNLSIGGCALRSTTPMEEDVLLNLELQLTEKVAPVQIEMARVRWVRRQEFGVEFLFMYDKERKVLLRWLTTASSQNKAA